MTRHGDRVVGHADADAHADADPTPTPTPTATPTRDAHGDPDRDAHGDPDRDAHADADRDAHADRRRRRPRRRRPRRPARAPRSTRTTRRRRTSRNWFQDRSSSDPADNSVTIDPGGTVDFAFPAGDGTTAHNVVFNTDPDVVHADGRRRDPAPPPPLPVVALPAGWAGNCTFANARHVHVLLLDAPHGDDGQRDRVGRRRADAHADADPHGDADPGAAA